MNRPAAVLTQVDVDLLSILDREPSLVRACARLGISRDTGVYRLRRLARALGWSVVVTGRGGAEHGGTRLSAHGRALLGSPPGSPVTGPAPGSGPEGNRWRGVYRRRPSPHVDLAQGVSFQVDFLGEDGEEVAVALDPEAVLLARGRFPSSARNVVDGIVARVRSRGPGTGGERRLVEVRVRGVKVVAAVTGRSVRKLHLAAGAPVVLYLKATALKRAGPRPTPVPLPR